MQTDSIEVECLGQSGFRLELGTLSLFIDPYLSDRVAEVHGKELRRLTPAPYSAASAPGCQWILITHIHDDHCDPDTLIPLLTHSPNARIVAPAPVVEHLCAAGFDVSRLTTAEEQWLQLSATVRVHPVPAAHTKPERDAKGHLQFVGYVLEYGARRIYHSGDTSPDDEVFSALAKLLPIEVAFLPVNERNYYRDRSGIIGNMSVREAFQMARDLGVKTLVPMHWDLLAPNCVFREELVLLYDLLRPPFRMMLNPANL